MIASLSNKNRIVHNNDCKITNSIKLEDIIYFRDIESARKCGYSYCNRCSEIGRLYRRDRSNIHNFISKNNLEMYIDDGYMYIDNILSSWKIGYENGSIILYHANSESYKQLKKENGHIIHHYHIQNYKGNNTILSVLEYIINHDKWKNNNVIKKSNRLQINSIYNLIEKMEYEKYIKK